MPALWMLGSGLALALMSVCVKLASEHFTAAELVFWRSVASVLVSVLLLRHMRQPLRTRCLGMHVHRGVSGFASMFMFYHALTALPVATAVTLNYTSPLFVAVLFAALMRERIGVRMAVALLVGFGGALLLLRPSMDAAQFAPALVGLGSGATAAVAFWNTRKLVIAHEPEERVVLYFALFCGAASFVWMLPQGWTPIEAHNVAPLAGVALLGTAGQLCLTRAWGRGNPLVMGTLSYSGIVFSAILGIAVFGDRLPWAAWLGMALIVGAGIAALRLRSARTAAVPATEG